MSQTSKRYVLHNISLKFCGELFKELVVTVLTAVCVVAEKKIKSRKLINTCSRTSKPRSEY